MAISPGINDESQEQLQGSSDTEAQANAAATLLEAAPDGEGSETNDPNLTTGPAEAEQQPATTPLTNESTQETSAPIPPATQATPPAPTPADMTQFMTAMMAQMQQANERAAQAMQLQLQQAMQIQQQQAEESNKRMLEMFSQLMTQNKQAPQTHLNPGQTSDEEGSDNETESSTVSHLPQASHHPNITRRGQDRAPSDSSSMLMEKHTRSTDEYDQLHPISKSTAFTYYNQNHTPLPNPCDPGTFNRWMHAYDRYKESCKAMGHPILPPHHAMGSEGQVAFQGLLEAHAVQMGKHAWANAWANAPIEITEEHCHAFQTYWQRNALRDNFVDVQQQITTAFRQHFGIIPVNVSQPLLQLQATLTKTAIHYGFRHYLEILNTIQSNPTTSKSLAQKCLSQLHSEIQKTISNVFNDETHPWHQARLESAPHYLTTYDIIVILRHFMRKEYRYPFGIPSTMRHTSSQHAVTTPKPPKKSPTLTGPQSGNTCPACHDNHDFLTWNSRTKRLNRNCSQKLSDTEFQTYKQAFLAANPGTAKLHKAAVEQHKSRLAKAKATNAKPSSSARRHTATSARSPQILTQPKDVEQLLKTPPARVYSNAQPTVPLSQKKSCIIDTCIFDSGATHSFLPPRLLAQIEKSIGPIETTPLCPSDPSTVHTGQGSSQIVKKVKLHIDLLLHLTQYGTLLHVTFYVPDNSYIGNELLLGETLLTQLGIPPAAAILQKTLAGTVFDQDTQSFHNRTDYDTSTATLTSSMKVLPTAQARRHLAKAVLSASDLPSNDPDPTVVKSSPTNPIDDYTPTPAQALQGLRNLDFNQGDSEILPDTFFEDIETNHNKHTADCHAELDQRIQEAIANGLDPALRNRLHTMVHDKYFSIFATSYRPDMKPWDVTPWTEPTYPLETVPTISKPASRRYTPAQLEFLEEHMAQLVAANRVRLWDNKIRHPDKLIGFAPAMLVPKPNGSFRVVWDFRQTNRFLQTIQLAPLRPMDVIHNIMNDRPSVYASLDAVSAFYQLSLAPESIQLFLLVTPNAIYECLHQPMGTVNSSQSFSLKMKECFGDLIDSHDLFNYIDDMLCAAQADEALLDKLERIFQRCADRHFYLNASKVCLYAQSIKFLGRILTSDGSVIPDPSRLDFIRTLDTPKTAGDLSSFLGTCSFLADHVPDLPRIIDPLRTLCTTALASSKKKTKRAGQKIQLQTRWTDEHTQAYTQAKQALLDSVPLHWPQPEDEINLFVDASDKGFGAVFAAVAPEEMLKPPRERSLKPLAFFGSRWTSTESRWATARQELIALIRSIRAHPEFLRPARSLIAYSDHLNISKVAARITDPNAKDLSVSIMTRASILLASLPIHICHIAGEDNIAADFLSRHATHVHKPDAFARVARSALAGLDAGDDLGFSMDNDDDSDRIDYTIGNKTYAYGRGFGPADVSSANIRTSTRTRRTRNFFTPGLPNPSSSPNVPSPPPPLPEHTSSSASTTSIPHFEETAEDEAEFEDSTEHQSEDIHALLGDQAAEDTCAIEPFTFDDARTASLAHGDFLFPNTETIRAAQQTALQQSSNNSNEDKITSKNGVTLINGLPTTTQDSLIYVTQADSERKRIWLPRNNESLIARVLLVAHAGIHGHQGIHATKRTTQEVFYLHNLKQQVTRFVQQCLHCVTTKSGNKMARPLGPTFVPQHVNEAIGIDFLQLFNNRTTGVQAKGYLLLCKCLLSQYVLLIPCTGPTAKEAVRGIVEWIKIFGAPRIIYSDMGSHFTAKLMQSLERQLGIDHIYSVPHESYTNGSVERANGIAIKNLSTLTNEFGLTFDQYEEILPLANIAMNSRQIPSLNGKSPLELMTAITPKKPLEDLVHPTKVFEDQAHARPTPEVLTRLCSELHAALTTDRMKARQVLEDSRAAARTRWDQRHRAGALHLQIGDAVTYVIVSRPRPSKLSPVWLGPARVTAIGPGNHLYTIEDIVSGETRLAHISRLRYYCDSTLSITPKLKDFIKHNSLSAFQGKLLNHFSKPDNSIFVRIQYKGIDPTDYSNEAIDLKHLHRSAPKIVRRYIERVARHHSRNEASRLRDYLGIIHP